MVRAGLLCFVLSAAAGAVGLGTLGTAAAQAASLWGQSVAAFKAEHPGVTCTPFTPETVLCIAGRDLRPRLGALGVIPGPCLDDQVAGFKQDRLTSVSCKVSVEVANLTGVDLNSRYGPPMMESMSIMQMQIGHTQWRTPGAYVMVVEYRGTNLRGTHVHDFQMRFAKDSSLPLGGDKAARPSSPAPQNPPVVTGSVQPSFDCTRAKSSAERLICADPELAALDQQLAGWQSRAMSSVTDPKLLRAQNIAAWKDREQRCRDKACLLDWFSSRKATLSTAQK